MDRRVNWLAAVGLGGVLGAAGMQLLHAQTPPPVYLVSEIDVIDQEAFREYSPRAGRILQDAGAKYLARGGKVVSVEGEPPKRFALLQFDSMDAAEAWRNSAASKELEPLQKKAIKRRAFLTEGLAR